VPEVRLLRRKSYELRKERIEVIHLVC